MASSVEWVNFQAEEPEYGKRCLIFFGTEITIAWFDGNDFLDDEGIVEACELWAHLPEPSKDEVDAVRS